LDSKLLNKWGFANIAKSYKYLANYKKCIGKV
jgi:hypothetical protein